MAAAGAAWLTSPIPQSSQNADVGASSAPHFGQRFASGRRMRRRISCLSYFRSRTSSNASPYSQARATGLLVSSAVG
jgi:hypothetical protein